MGDPLERFIVKSRDEFESEMPTDRMWYEIMRRQSTPDRWLGLWKVAAILFLFSTVYLVWDQKMSAQFDSDALIANSEIEQVEAYYTTMISQKREAIKQFNQSNLERDFLVEIDRLDHMYAELKKTYKHQNSTDLILDAMINNLQLRMNILDKQLEILKKLKKQQNETDTNIEI